MSIVSPRPLGPFSHSRSHSLISLFLSLSRTLFPPETREELSLVMCKISDVDPQARPYELSVEDVHRLCSAYKYLLEKHPEIRGYEYRASKKIISRKYLRSVEVAEMDEMDEMDEEMDDDCATGEEDIEPSECRAIEP